MATPASALPASHAGASGRYYRRFDVLDRVMHGFLMVTFIGCALTGIPLLVADHAWAQGFARLLGGFQVTMLIHRICAAIMIVVFVGHVVRVFATAARTGKWLEMVWSPNSMVPNLKDLEDVVGHVKWFLGKGPRPRFDRYTYWEKFDYMAVFWGMFIIGGSGLILWFAEELSPWLPGWVFNIATLVHGHEALLAVGFIFTIHFFNGHLRPEKFPMDMVIFTGRMPVEELQEDKPAEYEAQVAAGTLSERLAEPYQPIVIRAIRIFAWIALGIGFSIIVWIIYAMVFAYQ